MSYAHLTISDREVISNVQLVNIMQEMFKQRPMRYQMTPDYFVPAEPSSM